MGDETGINMLEIHTTLAHVVHEMERIGGVIEKEGEKNNLDHEQIKKQLVALDKQQALTDTQLKIQIGKISAIISALTAVALWLLKSGAIAAWGAP